MSMFFSYKNTVFITNDWKPNWEKNKKSSIIKWVLKQRHTVRCRQHHHETWNNLKGLCHVWFFQQGLGFWVWSIVFVPAQRPVVFIIHPQTKKRTMLTCPHIKTFWLYFWRSSTSLDISECLSVFFLGQTLKLQGKLLALFGLIWSTINLFFFLQLNLSPAFKCILNLDLNKT